MRKAKTVVKQTAGYQWAIRVGTELVAATMIGLGIGYMLDKWLGTRPWFLLLFFLFGVFAGFLNLYRVLQLDMHGDMQGQEDPGEEKDS